MKKIEEALSIIYERLKDKKIRWRVGGSTSLILQGMAIKTNDIDIITNKSGAYKINKLLKDYEINPVKFSRTDKFASHYGKFLIKGVEVEIIGDLQVNVNGHWIKKPLQISKCYSKVKGKKLIMPVFNLKLQLQSYERMGREKDKVKIEKIKRFIKKKR